MNTLKKVANTSDVSYPEAVAKMVEMLFDSLDTYGKKATSNLVDGWILVFMGRGIKQDELMPAAYEFLNRKDFPKPGEVCDWIEEHRENLEVQAMLRHAETMSAEEFDAKVRAFEVRHNLLGASRAEIQAVAIAAIESGRIRSIEGRPSMSITRAFSVPTEEETREAAERLERMKAELA